MPDEGSSPAEGGHATHHASAHSEHVSGSNIFSPSGLRVLVVDDDPLCLKVVGHMLQHCNYEVTTKNNGMSALEELRQHPNHYDLVLSDVYMPGWQRPLKEVYHVADMDGFKLLEHIGLELDLPVIMMSSNGETSVVLRGVTHGAVDFLIKPVRIEELRNVWQHVLRRRREVQKAHSGHSEDEHEDEAAKRAAHDKKRKSEDHRRKGDSDGEGGSTTKKARVVWSVEMHQQFVNAVNTLGVDKAVPKRILDLMNVEGLTRENVASHLQKYRLYLKRVSGVAPGGAAAGVGGRGGSAKLVRQTSNAAATTVGGPTTAAVPAQQPAASGMPGATGIPPAPMGMQQGVAGAMPDQIMRMQLQTLQMQAMSLGASGNPAMMPTSGPLVMPSGIPGMPVGAAMPLGGYGAAPMMGPLPGMTGGLEYNLPPPGMFPGDMGGWAMAAAAQYPPPDAGLAAGGAPQSSGMADASGMSSPLPVPMPQPQQPGQMAGMQQPLLAGQPLQVHAGAYPQHPSAMATTSDMFPAVPGAYGDSQQLLPSYPQQYMQQSQPQPSQPVPVPPQTSQAEVKGESMDDILNFFLKDSDAQ